MPSVDPGCAREGFQGADTKACAVG